ncbi:MAG: hypothetical protein ABF649_12025 [Bacillus sp. (in: firmicutes)]
MNNFPYQVNYPYYQQGNLYDPFYPRNNLAEQQTLQIINPAIQHGIREAQHLGYHHALKEAVAIGYLMGKGYDYHTAWRTVESWWRPPGTPLPAPY